MTSNYKNIHLAVLAIIISINLTSQEINQDFINSLPQNVKSDVLDQISKNISVNPKDEIRYSTFNTQITPDLTKEPYKNKILEDFSNIKDFGYSFFQSFPSTFMPINDPSADSSYILDVDDTISIQVIRGDMPSKDIVIDRDGAIYLPEIGRINLAGISLSNANLLINAKAKQYLIDTKVIVSW